MAVLFALPAIGFAVLAMREVLEGQVVIGWFTLAPLFGACAVGLWLMRPWGRTMALILALGNTGIATLGFLAAVLGRSNVIGPALFLAFNAAIAFALSRPAFSLPSEL